VKLLPWIDKESPKAPRLYGLRVAITWLEIKMAWKKFRHRKEPRIELPTGDDYSEDKPTEPHIRK